MKNLIVLVAVLIPGVALAQEGAESEAAKRERALVWTREDGGPIVKVRATSQFALDAIQSEKEWGVRAANKVLRQIGEARSAAELDALADALGRLVLESPSHKVAYDALSALWSAAHESRSSEKIIPYARGLDVLIEVYEAMDGTEAVEASSVLRRIRSAGGRGEDYVRNLFASLERPEKPCWRFNPYFPRVGPDGQKLDRNGQPVPPEEEWFPYETQWCEVGVVLKEYDLVYPICNRKMVKEEDGSWSVMSH